MDIIINANKTSTIQQKLSASWDVANDQRTYNFGKRLNAGNIATQKVIITPANTATWGHHYFNLPRYGCLKRALFEIGFTGLVCASAAGTLSAQFGIYRTS